MAVGWNICVIPCSSIGNFARLDLSNFNSLGLKAGGSIVKCQRGVPISRQVVHFLHNKIVGTELCVCNACLSMCGKSVIQNIDCRSGMRFQSPESREKMLRTSWTRLRRSIKNERPYQGIRKACRPEFGRKDRPFDKFPGQPPCDHASSEMLNLAGL